MLYLNYAFSKIEMRPVVIKFNYQFDVLIFFLSCLTTESNRTQVMAHIKNNINTALTSQKTTITSMATTTATATAMSKNVSNNSHSNNLTPSVIVLPQQNHQIVEQTSPLISPMESPRHSIILQPPSADLLQQPIILGQVSKGFASF